MNIRLSVKHNANIHKMHFQKDEGRVECWTKAKKQC